MGPSPDEPGWVGVRFYPPPKAMTYQLLLVQCDDPLSCLLRWLGAPACTIVGFSYYSAMSPSGHLSLFNAFDYRGPSFLTSVLNLNQLLDHPLVTGVTSYTFELSEAEQMRFQVTLGSLLTHNDRRPDMLHEFSQSCAMGKATIRDYPALVKILGSTSGAVLGRFRQECTTDAITPLRVMPKSIDRVKASREEALALLEVELSEVGNAVKLIGSQIDAPRRGYDKRGLHQALTGLGQILGTTLAEPRVELGALIRAFNKAASLSHVTALPEPTFASKEGLIVGVGGKVVKLPDSKLRLPTHGADLCRLHQEELRQLLWYLDTLTGLDPSYIALQRDITDTLARLEHP